MAWQINNRDPKTGLYNATNNGKPGLGQKTFNTGHETGQIVRGIVSPAGVSLDGKNQRARRDNSRRQEAGVIPALFVRYGRIDFGDGPQDGAGYYIQSQKGKANYINSIPSLVWQRLASPNLNQETGDNGPEQWFERNPFYTDDLLPAEIHKRSAYLFSGSLYQDANADPSEIPADPIYTSFRKENRLETGFYCSSFSVLEDGELTISVLADWFVEIPLGGCGLTNIADGNINFRAYKIQKKVDQKFETGPEQILSINSWMNFGTSGLPDSSARLDQYEETIPVTPGYIYYLVAWIDLQATAYATRLNDTCSGVASIELKNYQINISSGINLYPAIEAPCISAYEKSINFSYGFLPVFVFLRFFASAGLSTKLVAGNLASFSEYDILENEAIDVLDKIKNPSLNSNQTTYANISQMVFDDEYASTLYAESEDPQRSYSSFRMPTIRKPPDPDLQRQALRGRTDGNFVENTDKFYFVENFEDTVLPATKTLKNIQVSVADVSEDGDLGTPKKTYKRALPFKFGACPYPAEFVADRVVAIAPTSK